MVLEGGLIQTIPTVPSAMLHELKATCTDHMLVSYRDYFQPPYGDLTSEERVTNGHLQSKITGEPMASDKNLVALGSRVDLKEALG